MIDGTSLYVIQFISGVEGAELFNFFFSLVSAAGLLVFIPACCLKLIQRA
jgi:hypothetical protein